MIEKGKAVLFDYVLTVDDEEVDSSKGREPHRYVHGEGNIVRGLERQLHGLKEGDKKTIVVSPEEGYGVVDPEAFREIPKSQLSPGMELHVGTVLKARTQDGGSMPVVIHEVKEETVIVNFNHPLAGKELHFDITVVQTR
ncbi:MAG: peptidylprolyl isomerase [Thermoplasmata archaeon]|nr:MAG: peptidylprolyl isomerase [Thermoplasmata archaeon]